MKILQWDPPMLNLNMNPLNNPVSKKKKLLFNNLNKNNCNNLSRLIRMKSLSSLQAWMMSNYQAPSRYGIHWSQKLKNINHPIKKTNLQRPIYPTQEVIDISPGSEDEQQPLIPKTEEDPVSSPSSKIITEVLMNMNKEPQRDKAPLFDLGIEPLTRVVLSVANKFSLGFPYHCKNKRNRCRGTQTSYECEVGTFVSTKGVTEFATRLKYRVRDSGRLP
ncbi:hypothetical protein PIB30_046815 [Stylosanthes scabra]|uniref:Uncharacterized protein n=1 Tax=Stylosanthes scabra TaxID=79078 RepID=A0ABU6SGJ5_9FABA|nr:hypothetical protein [Stylosanthes scabra]